MSTGTRTRTQAPTLKRVVVLLPQDVADRLTEIASENCRSVSGEIRYRIEKEVKGRVA